MLTDRRIQELLAQWQEQHRRGLTPTPEDLCREYPELLDSFRQALRERGRPSVPPATVELRTRSANNLNQPPGDEARSTGPDLAAAPPGTVSESGPPLPPPRPWQEPVGRYQPWQFHARGGLGEVHLAHDVELDRFVALKRIQDQRADDLQARRHFLREASLTARLQHPGIVPVYGLVRDEQGRPCYAMRFIEGQSLREALEAFHQADRPGRDTGERNLAFRGLLTRFVAVCKTVAYAHSRGVIHLDLKPGNVMLGDFDETLVVDWGLARVCKGHASAGANGPARGEAYSPPAAEVESSQQEGHAVGTPAYMSPEQALGKWREVGPSSDVYSLGATLYSVLTGAPPFTKLEQAQQGQFRRPREVKPVPAALEAVCLKALALRPEDRYAGPRELARDVEQWLADEPVRAYPEPALARLRRWTRRHRTLVTSTVVLLVTAVAALTAGLILLGVEKARTEEQRRLADSNARTASEQRGLALQTLKDVIFDIQKGLENRPGLHDLRRNLLERARKGLDRVARSADTSRQIDHSMAWACFNLGDIYVLVGDSASARQQYREGQRIAQALVQADPADAEAQRDLSISCTDLGDVDLTQGDTQAALRAYQQSLDIDEALARADPRDASAQRNLSIAHERIARVLRRQGNLQAALQTYRQSLKIREELAQADPTDTQLQHDLKVLHGRLGDVYLEQGDSEAALQAYRRALEIAEALVQADPSNAGAQKALATAHDDLGGVLLRQGNSQAALEAYRQGLKIRKKLADDDPKNAHARYALSFSYRNLGEVYAQQGDGKAALQVCRQSLEICQALAQADPEDADVQDSLGLSYRNLGDLQVDQGDTQAALESYRQCLKINQALAQADPKDAVAQCRLGVAYGRLGNLQLDQGDTRAALESYGQSLKIDAALVQADPRDAVAQRHLSISYHKLGDVYLQQGDNRAALRVFRRSLEIDQVLARADYRDARAQRDLGVSWMRLGDVQRRLGEDRAALEAYREGLAIDQALTRADPRDGRARSDLLITLDKVARFLATCPEPELRDASQAVALAQQAVELAPQDGDHHNTLGVCQFRAGHWQAAVASLEKAIQLNKAGTGVDWFFLAMAHHQLGHKEQAGSCYDRAVQWMDKNKPDDPELCRFRAEAAALLRVDPKPGPNDSKPR